MTWTWVEEAEQEKQKAVKGVIYYDHSIKLWTMCLFDKEGNPLDLTEYAHYKRDIKEKMKDFPNVKDWEVCKKT